MLVIIFLPLYFAFGLDGLAQLQAKYGMLYLLVELIAGQFVFLAVQGRLLYKCGQTVGKRLMDIKITDLNGNLPTFNSVYGIRYLFMTIAPLVPIIGGLLSMADVLFIFRKDRRCIHDLLAGTKVVAA